MKLIGLAGPARVGKDSIADYLVETYGFLKFSFSDALYDEVQAGFGLVDQRLLRDGETKETPTSLLCLEHCCDAAFVELATNLIDAHYRATAGDVLLMPGYEPLSPRRVLQWWGTEYRRAQDENYWINRAALFVEAFLEKARAGEVSNIPGLVNTSVRFENECAFIRRCGGEIWHIYRREAEAKHLNTYVSEQRLPVEAGDKEIFNNGSLEQLGSAASILLGTKTQSITLEYA